MKACIDIGGTKVAVSLADGSGAPPVHRRSEPTATRGDRDALARQVLRMVDAVCADAGLAPQSVAQAGVASCGPFVLDGGCLEVANPNICGGIAGPARGLPNDWKTVPLEAPLRQRFARLRIENDAVAALEAERLWGALQGSSHCAYVTWSTGIGAGLCVDGRVLRGKNGNAGHAGHTFASDGAHGLLCGCGNVGDVEALVAGNALARRFASEGWGDAAGLMAAAGAGDARALAEVDELCRVLGRMLYNLVALLDLERISLGGGVFLHHRALLLPRLQAEVAAHLPALTAGVRLVPAGLGERVGDFGAVALVA
ncbi:ROK family protein [Ramlibacter sp. H39-3-26]|uniref:ROK family protein n=1 Tax=Curvibacter soli TaxID=3031331 RepID=UPI0023DCCDB0|nr:ROK family protein [Ramlibacter sp. H39-3-26]MDF1484539.1 ROK family protein [Ramlibacter sp. H39-3-26]